MKTIFLLCCLLFLVGSLLLQILGCSRQPAKLLSWKQLNEHHWIAADAATGRIIGDVGCYDACVAQFYGYGVQEADFLTLEQAKNYVEHQVQN